METFFCLQRDRLLREQQKVIIDDRCDDVRVDGGEDAGKQTGQANIIYVNEIKIIYKKFSQVI